MCILISQLPCEKLGLHSWLMKGHLVRRRCLADEARLPANSQHQGSRLAWGHLACSSPSSCPVDTMWNRVEPSLLSLAWTPDPQREQKHDWCFKLLEQTNEKWHDTTAHTARSNMLFPSIFCCSWVPLCWLVWQCFTSCSWRGGLWKFTGNLVFSQDPVNQTFIGSFW